MRLVRVVALATGVASACVANVARAEERATIAIVREFEDPALVRQLRIEIMALGYNVTEIAPAASGTPLPMESRQAPAFGAVLLLTSTEGNEVVQVWDEPNEGGGLLCRAVENATPDVRVTAFRVVERLRSALAERRTAAVAPVKPAPQAKPNMRSAPPPPARAVASASWAAGLRLAELTSPGGLGRTSSLVPSLEVLVGHTWGFAALGFVPLESSEVSSAEGSARVRIGIIGAGPTLRLQAMGTPLQLDLGAGGGAVIMAMRGTGRPPFTSLSDVASSPLMFGSAFLSYDFGAVALSSGVLLGEPFRTVEVRFADHRVATWGRPFGAALLGLTFHSR